MKEYNCQRRRHCSEADLPQCWYCKDNRPLPGSSYASIPGEILTIRRTPFVHPFGCKITSDKRTMYGAQYVYHSGLSDPNYPVPSTIGMVQLQAYPGIVCIDTPDTDNYVWAYDQWQHKQVFPLID